MTIRKRNNIYYYDFRCNGKRYRGSTGQTTEKTARQFEKDKITHLKNETSAAALAVKIKNNLGIKILLDDAFERFLKTPRQFTPDKKQRSIYKAQWGDFAAYIKDNYPNIKYLSEIDAKHANEYIQYIRNCGRWQQNITYTRNKKNIVDNKRMNKSISVTTQNKYLNTCNLVFDTILKDTPHGENPFKNIPKIIGKKETREAFSIDELRLIGEKAKDKYFYPVFLVGISTGLRLGDICNLKKSVVDMQKAWIDKLIMRKTGREVSFPILPGLYDYLMNLTENKSEYIFPALQARYSRNPSGISKDIRNFLEDIGIKTTRQIKGRKQPASIKGAHSLRHTFAYLAGIHSIPLPIVQSILGHMSPEMTSIYSDHATAEAKRTHLAKLPDYLTLPSKENTDKYRLAQTDTNGDIKYIIGHLENNPGHIAKVMEFLKTL